MTVFNSKINPGSESFRKNREEMLAHIAHLQELNSRGAMISERRRPRFEARGQLKYFFAQHYERSYSVGPGVDLILHWLLTDAVQPFSAVFGEYLYGTELSFEGERVRTPDNYLLRNLTGLIFPGKWGEVQVFNSIAYGHGKGLLAYRREALWGFGVRVVPFE